MEDWRLNGQEKYLQGATLYKIVFPQFWLKAVTERNSFYEMTAERARRFADQMQRGEEYLKGDELRHFFHEHCEFCMEKVTTDKECEFYCTTDMQHWVCSECFNDFKELFAWKVEQYKCERCELCISLLPNSRKMIDINEYINKLIAECRVDFGERLLYVGLQGSYLRGEANENSDIDIMLVIDSLSVEDMDAYRTALQRLGHFEKSCGFICGRDELVRWNPLEVCQLRHTTKDILGSLDELLPQAARQDEVNYVKFSLGNLYHELCHRYIHAERSKNEAKLRGSCKALFFLIQNLHYLESGDFVLKKSELMGRVSDADRNMLAMAELEDDFDFDLAFSAVFDWCKNAFLRIEAIACADTEG